MLLCSFFVDEIYKFMVIHFASLFISNDVRIEVSILRSYNQAKIEN
jgi:hypothetical protein